jgi:thiol-disulfide isomerase/thioredoxin
MQRRMRITSSNGGPPTRSSTWLCWKVLALLCTATTFTAAFTLQMDYKPPVKSSVRKIYDSRFPRDTSPSRSGSTSGSGSGKPRKDELPSRSSSAKSAYAGALSAPLPISGASRMTQSFERRMRDLVLGGKDVVRRSSTVAPTATNTRKLPSNVLTVESLQDYKKVVADEPEKMVAVRFYAPWCKACKAVAPHFYHMAVKKSKYYLCRCSRHERQRVVTPGPRCAFVAVWTYLPPNGWTRRRGTVNTQVRS